MRPLPTDIVFSLLHRYNQPLNYLSKQDRERRILRNLRHITFAAVKKYRNDTYKEEWNLSLDQNCKDRSYLYGRLLAIADKLESDTYGESDARLTNATRMQAAFAQHPGTTWMILSNKLTPYKQRLMKQNPAALHRYERLIRAILDDINVNDPERNRPLDDRYVLGYSHQYAAFYRKNETPAEAPAEPTEPADPAVTE